MGTHLLTSTQANRSVVAGTTSGLWRAMTHKVRTHDTIPTVEVSDLAPRASMFDYDPAEAEVLLEVPDFP